MKVFKYILQAVFFIGIASAVFFTLVSLFDVEKTAELRPSGNLKNEDSEVENPTSSDNRNDSMDNYSLNKGSTIALADETLAALPSQIDINEILKRALPSVVSVTAKVPTAGLFGQSYESTVTGSGILLYAETDCIYVATNYHVVESATDITLTLADGTAVYAEKKGSDSAADLAILTVNPENLSAETLSSLQYATPADSEKTEIGDMVIAIGNPLGQGISVTVGYISALERKVNVNGIEMTLIQTDAAINPGNSGGALINLSGELVGINSAKLADTSAEGMGFAIPISTAIPILDELKNLEVLSEEERGYLGAYIQTVTSDIQEALGWPIGVLIKEIVPGGAAENSALMTGDIITAVNGITITTKEQLAERVNCYRHGTTIVLTVERLTDTGFETISIDFVLGAKPEGIE